MKVIPARSRPGLNFDPGRPLTRGVEGFDVQGSVVGEVGMSSSIEVLFKVVGVFEADGAVG